MFGDGAIVAAEPEGHVRRADRLAEAVVAPQVLGVGENLVVHRRPIGKGSRFIAGDRALQQGDAEW